jgi:6-phosphofructokinase
MEPRVLSIAINHGGGYGSGLNAILTGVVLASAKLRWDVVGIRDGFDASALGNQGRSDATN